MKRLFVVLAMTALLPSYIFQSYGQEEYVRPERVAIAMVAYQCDDTTGMELVAYSEIAYNFMFKYYTPSLPQVYCFEAGKDIEEQIDAFDFLLWYNDIVIVMFEDDLWFSMADNYSSAFDLGDLTEEAAEGLHGINYYEVGLVLMQYTTEAPYEGFNAHDFNSITLTHELSHQLLYLYDCPEAVFGDWVDDTFKEYLDYESDEQIYSFLTGQWYEVYEIYPDLFTDCA